MEIEPPAGMALGRPVGRVLLGLEGLHRPCEQLGLADGRSELHGGPCHRLDCVAVGRGLVGDSGGVVALVRQDEDRVDRVGGAGIARRVERQWVGRAPVDLREAIELGVVGMPDELP